MRSILFLRTMARVAAILLALGASTAMMVGCASNQGPKPPKPRISNLPQNLPQSWEGQSQMGGMPTSY